MRVPLSTSFLLVLALCAPAYRSTAQSYRVDHCSITGGGGTSTGGIYAVSGSVGQPDCFAKMQGGNYSLTSGFWSLLVPVQTPGAPTLTIKVKGSQATISWPSSRSFVLQQSTDLRNPNGWSIWHAPVTDDGKRSSAVVPVEVGTRYFRLTLQ